MRQKQAYSPLLRSPFSKTEENELSLALLAIFAVLSSGVLGYMTIENWGFLDALYMTVITLTTVGYSETHPLTPEGRVFTIILIVVGVGMVMYFLTAGTRIVLRQQLRWIFDRNTMQNQINHLQNHTIFCGYGKLSALALQQLITADMPLVVIDNDEEKCRRSIEDGFLVVKGDATQEDILELAGVHRAKRVVTLLSKDSDNLYVVLTCKELNPALYIISRSEDDSGEKRLKRAGADRIISPYRVGGQKIADGLTRPYVSEFLDVAATSSAGDLLIEEIVIPKNSPIAGKSLGESEIRDKTNIIVAALIDCDGKMIPTPSSDSILEGGMTLIGLGGRNEFERLEKLFRPE